jgi:hypothetical protein
MRRPWTSRRRSASTSGWCTRSYSAYTAPTFHGITCPISRFTRVVDASGTETYVAEILAKEVVDDVPNVGGDVACEVELLNASRDVLENTVADALRETVPDDESDGRGA